MKLTRDLIDRWFASQYYRLKERIATTSFLDEDSFHDAYMAMRKNADAETFDADLTQAFMKVYRQILKKELDMDFTYTHPDELFFILLSAGEEAPEEPEQTGEDDITLKEVDNYVKSRFKPDEYQVFMMRFYKNMNYKFISEYTGKSPRKIQGETNRMLDKIYFHFRKI